MAPATDTLSLLERWWADLDAAGLDDAYGCLLSGSASRRLLQSLRTAVPAGAAWRHGLDDPHSVAAGSPLSATVQTFLRERLLTRALPSGASRRWSVPAQRAGSRLPRADTPGSAAL